ncbi:MAG: Ig-like domain-containing protein [Dehalococcoidales bacterium]
MKRKQMRFFGYLLSVVMAVALTPLMTACGSKTTTPVLTSVTVTIIHSSSNILTMHSTMQLDATGTYSNGTTPDVSNDVVWASSNPTVAVVQLGVATGLAPGTADITAILDGVTSPAVTIIVTALSSVVIAPAVPVNLAVGSTQQYTATGINWDGSTVDISSQVTWASDTPTTATISSTGLATAVAVGTANITASASGVTSRAIILTVIAATSTTQVP